MPRWVPILLVSLAVLGGLLWLYLGKALLISGLKARIAGAEAEREALLARISELSGLLARRDDPALIEEMARKLLHFGYPGEVRVVFVR